jgi:hypothetical protein
MSVSFGLTGSHDDIVTLPMRQTLASNGAHGHANLDILRRCPNQM